MLGIQEPPFVLRITMYQSTTHTVNHSRHETKEDAIAAYKAYMKDCPEDKLAFVGKFTRGCLKTLYPL